MATGLFATIRTILERDRNVRLVANDPALTSELLLLFRVMLADGMVQGEELDAFKRICEDAFGLDPHSMEGVYRYLQDYGYDTNAEQMTAVFAELSLDRRKMLLDHMIAIAEADQQIDANEMRLLQRTSDMLGFDLKPGH